MIDPIEFGKAMGIIVKDAVSPLQQRLEAVERALAEIPEAVHLTDLLSSDGLKTMVDLQVTEAIAEYFAANPVENGKDGADGKPGADGLAGENGRDGLDVKDLFRADGGRLVAVMSDGTTKDLGVFVGKDGKDGLSFENASGEYDAERGFVLRLAAGDRTAEFVLPYMKHVGFWTEGMTTRAAESTTHDGALWIAKRDNASKPCMENQADWILAARKGRDAVQMKPKSQPRGPIRLESSNG